MKTAIDVTLKEYHKAIFPPQCVVCHCKTKTTTKVAHNSANPLLVVFIPIFAFFVWSKVTIPVCKSCKPKFLFQRWGRELTLIALIIVGAVFLWPHFSDMNALARKLSMFGSLIVLAIPYILFEVFWPRVFNTTARGEKIDYEFTSKSYAVEFYKKNEKGVVSTDLEYDDLYPSEVEQTLDDNSGKLS
jgi:hypothetical protein